MGDEYTETVDTSSDMDTSEDFSEDVSADSNDIVDDIPEDIPEDVPEDFSADSDDMVDDIQEDISEDTTADIQSNVVNEAPSDETEETAFDVSADEQPADTQDDMVDEVPSDETGNTASDASADEQPADTQDDMADEASSDETEDTAFDVSADEQPADTQDDMVDEVPSDETGDIASDASADEQPADTQDDMADEAPLDETEDTASDVSADEQPADAQDDMADDTPSDETEDTVSDVSADEQPADTQDDMANESTSDETGDIASNEQPVNTIGRCPKCGKPIDQCTCTNDGGNDTTFAGNDPNGGDAFRQLSEYMNEHNYGLDDFATYSQDPEWQRLHSNAYPDYTPPEASSTDTQENSFRQLSEYMNEHNYGPDDFATYSQDPEWQRLHSNAYPDYIPLEKSSADTQENSFRQLSEYMNEHNYGPDDFAIYSQDPEWQQLHSNAYPDYVLPEDSSEGIADYALQNISEDTATDTQSDIANEALTHPNEDTVFNVSANTQDDINDEIPTTETEDTVLNTQDDIDIDVPTAETEDTVLDTQDDMNSDVPASETEDMVPDTYDDKTYDDMDNEAPVMKDGANDTNWNPFKPKKETKNAYDWNKNEWEPTPVVRDMPPKSNTDSKEYSSMVDALEKANVEYRSIQLAEQGRTEQDIINRLSGGDMTKGSCSSLALAYAGNKAGYDVLDFRDGDSRVFFSSRSSIQTVADMPGVNSTVLQGTNDIATANQLLSGIQAGKEYYLATGGHAAIVRRDGNGYQYLELQHPSNGNGWHSLSDYILRQRFGCKDSRPYECSSYLMDVDSLANSSEFRNLLGYINTAASSQKKGVYGNVR